MAWTDERVELLKKLWAEGLSASQIAGRLGSVTRNAVIGKVHRLGLSGRQRARSDRARRGSCSRPRPRFCPLARPGASASRQRRDSCPMTTGLRKRTDMPRRRQPNAAWTHVRQRSRARWHLNHRARARWRKRASVPAFPCPRSEPGGDRFAILIADDHPLLRGGLRTVLSSLGEAKVVGGGATGAEAVRARSGHGAAVDEALSGSGVVDDALCLLPATEQARAPAPRGLLGARAGRGAPRPHRAHRSARQRDRDADARARAGGRGRGRSPRARGERSAAAARPADRAQGSAGHGRRAHDLRLAVVPRPCAGRRLPAGRAHARGRRDPRGQDEHAGVRARARTRSTRSSAPRATPGTPTRSGGRLERWRRRRARLPDAADRRRQRPRRLACATPPRGAASFGLRPTPGLRAALARVGTVAAVRGRGPDGAHRRATSRCCSRPWPGRMSATRSRSARRVPTSLRPSPR